MVLKQREKILLFFVIIAVAIWSFDRFYYGPQQKKISQLKGEIQAADLKLNEFMVMAKGVETAEAEILRLEKDLQGWRERMLRGVEFRAFLKHLAKDSHRLQMKIVSLLPQEVKISTPEGKKEISAPPYRRVTIQMVLHSTYPALEAYLKGIEGLPFLVTVDNLQVEREEKIMPFLKVTMGLSVHIVSL